MGLSVSNQVDEKNYFSLSHINPEFMKDHGLTISANKLRQIARRSPNYFIIYTGQSKMLNCQRRTKIFKYEDFKGAQ